MSKKVATILYKLEELSSEIHNYTSDQDIYIRCPGCDKLYMMPYNFCPECGENLKTQVKEKYNKERKFAKWFTMQLKDILGITDKELFILFKNEGYNDSIESLELTTVQAADILNEIIFNIRLMISEAGLIYMKIVVDDITKDDITIVKERCANYIKKMDEAHEKTKDSKLVFKDEGIKAIGSYDEKSAKESAKRIAKLLNEKN